MRKAVLLNLVAGIFSIGLNASAQDWEIPRTAEGRPDLQGVWTNKTLTPLTRNRELGEQRALTEEQKARLEDGHQNLRTATQAAGQVLVLKLEMMVIQKMVITNFGRILVLVSK